MCPIHNCKEKLKYTHEMHYFIYINLYIYIETIYAEIILFDL